MLAARSMLYSAAVTYITNGWPVFPLHPNTKKPIYPHGYMEASTRRGQIDNWWMECPDANIAMPTAGHLVIDVDEKNGLDGLQSLRDLEAIHGPLPITRSQQTPSGGMHLIFDSNGKYVPSRISCPAIGLDTRGDGGYIVLAPSVINGVVYQMSDGPIADMPEWLHSLIVNHPVNLGLYVGALPVGTKHRLIFDVSLECHRNGLTLEETIATAHTVNRKSTPVLSTPTLERHITAAFYPKQPMTLTRSATSWTVQQQHITKENH